MKGTNGWIALKIAEDVSNGYVPAEPPKLITIKTSKINSPIFPQTILNNVTSAIDAAPTITAKINVINNCCGAKSQNNINDPIIITAAIVEIVNQTVALDNQYFKPLSAFSISLNNGYIKVNAIQATYKPTLIIYGAIPWPLFSTVDISWWDSFTGVDNMSNVSSLLLISLTCLAPSPNDEAKVVVPSFKVDKPSFKVFEPSYNWLAPEVICLAPSANCWAPLKIVGLLLINVLVPANNWLEPVLALFTPLL